MSPEIITSIPVEVEPDSAIAIPLTGKWAVGDRAVTWVPAEFHAQIISIGKRNGKGKWNCTKPANGKTMYATRSNPMVGGQRGTMLFLHVLIMKLAGLWVEGLQVDHRDGNGLNNRLSNLRMATNAQNQRNCKRKASNKSGAKGVSWCKRSNLWRAQIWINNSSVTLGYFDTIEEGAEVYKTASAKHYGEFARTD